MVGRRNGHKGWLHGTIKLVAVQVRKYIEMIGAKFLTAWKVTYKHEKGADKKKTQLLD